MRIATQNLAPREALAEHEQKRLALACLQGAWTDAAHDALRDQGAQIVHDIVAAMDGSISAEHGLGAMKGHEALRYKSPVEVAALRAVRDALDPRRIMNPRALF